MSETLQVVGCVAAAAAVSLAMLSGDRRLRAGALLGSLAIALALLLGEGWDELASLRDRPAAFAALAAAGAAGITALALALRRGTSALPLLLVAALPFRIPIEVSGEEANLLIPLYVVIAAGALAYGMDAAREGGKTGGAGPRPLLIVLAAAVVLYALQAAYSEDVGFATRNVGFFLVPFAAMFVLLGEVRWTPRLLALSFAVLVGEAVLFALVGLGQALAQEIFWNPALEKSNAFHFYFRVNSLFWDPNIYGRYLGLAGVLVLAVVLWTEDSRRTGWLAAVLAVLLGGLLFGFSQTSFIALLCGAAVLFALRLSFLWTAILAPLAAIAVVGAVIVLGGTSEAEDDPREISSGRTTLIEGGADLARAEPLIGHGSASFSVAFAEQEGISTRKTTISHNEPVTIAAEQGAAGILVYLALVATSIWALLGGMRSIAPGLGAPADAVGDPAEGGDGALGLARIALVAAFAAMLVHTIGYGGFLTDPLTWALLAIGGSLASAAGVGGGQHQTRPRAAAGDSRGAARRSEVQRPGGR